MSDTAAEPVLVKEQRGAVLVLRLNRPEARNALNPELLSAVGLSMLEAEADPGIRCVVLTGTGDRAFCSGMDLRAFAEGGGMGSADPEGMKGFGKFTGVNSQGLRCFLQRQPLFAFQREIPGGSIFDGATPRMLRVPGL